jgi:hypothetical protein
MKDLPTREALLVRLKEFLEIHLKSRIVDANSGILKMNILHCKNSFNKTPKEKLINYKLFRIQERLLESESDPNEYDTVVCDFLIQELSKYYKKTK